MRVDSQSLAFELYDVIIVGSGPAGSLLAERLAAKNQKCLIIETGGERFDTDLQRAFSTMKGQGHFDGAYWPQHWTRTFGGTSTVWSGWCASLDPRDFAAWPIGREALDPYYPYACDMMGRDPVIATYTAPDIEGFEQKPFSLTNAPLRIAERFADFVTLNAQVDVLLETTVCELIPNESRSRVTGLSLFTPEAGRRQVSLRDGQTLVLAAGGIGNAQLMLTPTGTSEIGVGNETDMAGRCLMEHPHFYDVGRVVLSPAFRRPEPPANYGAYADALIPDQAIYDDIGQLAVAAQFEYAEPNPSDATERFLLRKYGADAIVRSLHVRSEMRADPNNRVTLTRETDPSGLPRANALCVIGSDDLRAVQMCLTRLGEAFAATDLGRLRIDNESLFRAPTGGGHTMGTTRMGDDPNTSVVNRDCRVHRYENLFVAGSSVFTTGGASNPTLTIAALSARLADHLTGARA